MEPTPFIKWAGGKQALASVLKGFFPQKQYLATYYEPFLGGGSIFYSLRPEKAILNDSNRWLIDTYIAIRDDWRRVADILVDMPNTKDAYLEIRSRDTKRMDLYERAATFIYLNKTGFRGLFRVNRKGQFNVPWGAYDRRYFDPENLETVSQALTGVTLRATDFELALADAVVGDFIYFDPPYHPVGGYSDFKRYTPEQFGEADQVRLAALCRELDARGIRWAVSNSDTQFIRQLYSPYRIYEVNARREINLNSTNRDIVELLITNVPLNMQQRNSC